MTEPDAPISTDALSPLASGTGASASRPSDGRLFAIVLLGPVIGTGVVVLTPFLIKGNSGGPLSELAELLLIALPFGYVSGFLSAIIAAFAYFFAYRRLPRFWPRLLGTLVIGAVSGPLGIVLISSLIFQSFRLEPELIVMPAIAGAIALAVTALAFDGMR